jgi:hypothetical protein
MGVAELAAIAGPKIINAVSSGVRTLRKEMVRPTLLAKAAEWPRGAAFLACDIAEIIKTADQIDLIEHGAPLQLAKYPTCESSRLATAKQVRNKLLIGAAGFGLAASIQNIAAMRK